MTQHIEYRRSGSWEIMGTRFLKGPNYIEDDVWERIKKHPLTQVRLDEGDLIERTSPRIIVPPKQQLAVPSNIATPKADPATLPGMNVPDAIELVNRTENLQQLTEWEASETRRTVKRAIAERINSLQPKENVSLSSPISS